MGALTRLFLTFTVFALLAMSPDIAEAQNCDRKPDHPKCQTDPGTDPGPDPDPGPEPAGWMHPDVAEAHKTYTGVDSHMITVDSFSGTTYSGNLDGTTQSLTHGQWTYLQSYLVAPGASRAYLDHNTHSATDIYSTYSGMTGLTAVNLSFGLIDPAGTDVDDPAYSLGTVLWDSLVDEAHAGSAVFVKAAGNTNGGTVDGTFTVRTPRPRQYQDSLNLLLIGAEGALFVGALDGNGTVANPASIASYSTIAGPEMAVQEMFLVVGVEDGLTNLAGTSFAAPIVTGYAAILGEKFDTASAAQIVDQLLDTARMDTVQGNDPSIYGQGEASLANALGPDSIN